MIKEEKSFKENVKKFPTIGKSDFEKFGIVKSKSRNSEFSKTTILKYIMLSFVLSLLYIYVRCNEVNGKETFVIMQGMCLVIELIRDMSDAKGRIYRKVFKPDKEIVKNVLEYNKSRNDYSECLAEVLRINSEFKNSGTMKYLGRKEGCVGKVFGIDANPVDSIVKNMLISAGVKTNFAGWRRDNAIPRLQVKYMKKFMRPQIKISKKMMKKYEEKMGEVFEDIGFHKDPIFQKELVEEFEKWDNFDNIKLNPKSAVGYPLDKKYNNKKDALVEAKELAKKNFVKGIWNVEHFWKVGGRGKLQRQETPGNARLVEYQGMQRSLILFKYFQPMVRSMMRGKDSSASAIGHKWVHGGADKFISDVESKVNIEKSVFATWDISTWDANVQAKCFRVLYEAHIKLIRKVCKGKIEKIKIEHWCKTIRAGYEDMITAKIVLPFGFMYQVMRGMKSGWVSTAPDNTLLHLPIIKIIQEEIFKNKKNFIKGYGDDGWSAIQDFVFNEEVREDIMAIYAKFGHKIKPGSFIVSDNIEKVDFLSKRLFKRGNNYVPWRPADDTFLRLVYPDTFRVHKKHGFSEYETAERVMGHYLDNFFNKEVRKVLGAILQKLRVIHGVRTFNFSDERKKDMFNKLGLNISSLPTVPVESQICELYGVSLKVLEYKPSDEMERMSKVFVETRATFNVNVQESSSLYGKKVETQCLALNDLRSKEEDHKENYLNKLRVTPFMPSPNYRGNAGGKIGESLKNFFTLGLLSVKGFKRILDVGSHPGSALVALKDWFPQSLIKAVSVFPKRDKKKRGFCYKAKGLDGIDYIESDILDYNDSKKYDIINVDIAMGIDDDDTRPRNELVEDQAFLTRDTYERFHSDLFVGKFLGFGVKHLAWLYDVYKNSGHFSLKKLCFSYPWNNEYHLLVDRSFISDKKVSKKKFFWAINAFRNSKARSQNKWIDIRDRTYGRKIENPYHLNEKFQIGLEKLISPPVYVKEFSLNSYSEVLEKSKVEEIEAVTSGAVYAFGKGELIENFCRNSKRKVIKESELGRKAIVNSINSCSSCVILVEEEYEWKGSRLLERVFSKVEIEKGKIKYLIFSYNTEQISKIHSFMSVRGIDLGKALVVCDQKYLIVELC